VAIKEIDKIDLNTIEGRTRLNRIHQQTGSAPLPPAKNKLRLKNDDLFNTYAEDQVKIASKHISGIDFDHKTASLDKKKWTVLFYVDGENNLAPMAMHSFSGLKKIGSDENVNLVALLSVKGYVAQRGLVEKEESRQGLKEKAKFAFSHPVFPGAEKVKVIPGQPSALTRVMNENGEKEIIERPDMGSYKTLQNFMEWGMEKYPAEHYALVLWDHGAGFLGSMSDESTKHLIKNQELAQVLGNIRDKNGKKIDLVDFNACLMGQAEVAYEIKDGANYMVASEETEAGLMLPLPGVYGTTPQHKVMADLKAGIQEKGDVSGEELAKLYVYETKNQMLTKAFTPTQSAVDLSRMDKVADDADRLAGVLLDKMEKDPKALNQVRKEIKRSQAYLALDMFADPYNDYRDLADFAQNIAKSKYFKNDPDVKEAAENLYKTTNSAVIAEYHVTESQHGKLLAGSHGMSAYLPHEYGFQRSNLSSSSIQFSPNRGYDKMAFAKDTRWEKLLKKVAQDKPFYNLMKKAGAQEEKVNSVDKGMARIKKNGVKPLPWAYLNGYWMAKDFLQQGEKVMEQSAFMGLGTGIVATITNSFWAGLGMVGGAIRTVKGVNKFKQGFTNHYDNKTRATVLSRAAIETAIGVSTVVFTGALLTGLGMTVALPAAAVTLGLGVARTGYTAVNNYRNSRKADRTPISEKIEIMNREQEKKMRSREIA